MTIINTTLRVEWHWLLGTSPRLTSSFQQTEVALNRLCWPHFTTFLCEVGELTLADGNVGELTLVFRCPNGANLYRQPYRLTGNDTRLKCLPLFCRHFWRSRQPSCLAGPMPGLQPLQSPPRLRLPGPLCLSTAPSPCAVYTGAHNSSCRAVPLRVLFKTSPLTTDNVRLKLKR